MNNQNKNIPLFGALRMLLEDFHPYSKTIFTVLESEELVEKTVAVVQEVVGDISSTGVGFFNNTIDYLFANVPEFKDSVIPYVIVNGTIGSVNATAFYIIGSIALFTLLHLIYVIVNFIRRKYTKDFDKYLQNNQTLSLSAIEADFEAAKQFGKEIWIGKNWTIFITGVRGHIHDNKDIIWAYYYQRTGKYSVSEVKLYQKNFNDFLEIKYNNAMTLEDGN